MSQVHDDWGSQVWGSRAQDVQGHWPKNCRDRELFHKGMLEGPQH